MKLLISLLCVAILGSCGTGNKVNKTDYTITQKKWELIDLNGKKVIANQPVYIELADDNTVSGFAGCNRLNGSYNIENESQIKFSQIATTRMACPENEMELESQVLELLNTTNNFAVNNGKLMFNVGKRAPLATFYIMNEHEVVNKYWKLIKLGGWEVQMAENQQREQFFIMRSDGRFSGFGGCNQFSGEFELSKGNGITFKKNIAATLKACPDVDKVESGFLDIFGVADNYTIKNDTLNLNVGKRAPLAVFEAVYF